MREAQDAVAEQQHDDEEHREQAARPWRRIPASQDSGGMLCEGLTHAPEYRPGLREVARGRRRDLDQTPSNPAADCLTCLGCSTGKSVESTISVSGSPTSSGSTALLKGSRKRPSLRARAGATRTGRSRPRRGTDAGRTSPRRARRTARSRRREALLEEGQGQHTSESESFLRPS